MKFVGVRFLFVGIGALMLGLLWGNTLAATGMGSDAAGEVASLQPVSGSFGQITKTVGQSEVWAPWSIYYSITLPYTGGSDPNQALSGARITDQVPSELTNVTWNCFGDNLTCEADNGTGNDIDVGATLVDRTVDGSVTVTIGGTLEEGTPLGTFTNEVCAADVLGRVDVGTIHGFVQPAENCASVDVTVMEQPAFGDAAKTVDVSSAQAGDTVVFTASLPFTGGPNVDFRVFAADVSDEVPAAFEVVSATCQNTNFTCNGPSVTGNLVEASGGVIDSTEDGLFSVVIVATVADGVEPGSVTNTACVTGTVAVPWMAAQEPCAQGELVSASVEIEEADPGTLGAVTKTADVTQASSGESVTYTVSVPWIPGNVANLGVGVSITDEVPLTLDNVQWTCTGVNITCSALSGAGNSVAASGTIVDTTVAGEMTVTITGTVATDAELGTVTNTACATLSQKKQAALGFFAQTDNCASASFEVIVQEPGAFGAVTKTVTPTDVLPNQQVTYTVTVPWIPGNNPSQTANVVVTDNVPTNIRNVSWTCNGANISCSAPAGNFNNFNVTGTVTDPTINGAMTITIVGYVDMNTTAGTIINTACAAIPGGSGQGDRTNGAELGFLAQTPNCASATITVDALEPVEVGQITKTVDISTAQVGDVVTYTVTFPWSAGTTPWMFLQSLTITDSVPASLESVTWTCAGTNMTCSAPSGSGNQIDVSGEPVDRTVDGALSLTIIGTVASGTPASEIVNTACGSSLISILAERQNVLGSSARSEGKLGFRAQAENCASAIFTVVAEETPTITPTPSPTVAVTPAPTIPAQTPVPTDPATPIIPTPTEGVETPTPTQPTQSAQPTTPPQGGSVTSLPKTGTGQNTSTSVGLMLIAMGILAITALATTYRLRRR